MPAAGSMTGVPITPVSGAMSPEPPPTRLPVVPEGTEVSPLLAPCAVSMRFACQSCRQGPLSASKANRPSWAVATNTTLCIVPWMTSPAIHRAGEQLAEAARVHVGRRQRVLLRVGAVPGNVVVIGVDAGQIRDEHAGAARAAPGRDAAGRHGVA